jgi:hypothetical protein
MLGGENFDALARALWHVQPPVHGDLAQWGGALAEHIEAMRDLVKAEPFLADVARVEWALHQAATVADAAEDPVSFALLTHIDPAHLGLVLSPGVICLSSRWPIVTLIQTHLCDPPELVEATRSLANGEGEVALVWRDGLRPRLRHAQPGEAEFISAIQKGQTLLEALDGARKLNFGDWLAPAVHERLLLRVVQGTEKQ